MATVDQIIGVESGGNPYAKNPRSSATGSGQFLSGTWLEMINRHRPDLAQGRSREEILQMRNDPNLSRDMTQFYADQNSAFLKSKGIDPTPANTYLAHFLGPGGASAVHANPGETVRALLGDQAVAANPFLQGMTGQDVIDWAGRKMTPSQHMAKNIRKQFGTPETPAGAAPQGDDMGRLKAALSGKSYDPDKLSGADRLIEQGQDIAGTSGNPWGAIGGTILAGLGGYERGQERGNEKAYRQELGQTLGGAEDPMTVARTLMASPDPKLQQAGIEMFTKIKSAASRGGSEDFNKNIVYGVNEKGENVPIQFSDQGRAIQTQLPEGVQIGKDPIRLDAGTHWVLLDPVTRQPVGQIPKDLAGAESEKVQGKAEGEAISTRPQATQALGNAYSNLNRLKSVAEGLRSAEGLEAMTGLSSNLYSVRGSTRDAEAQLNTLKSQIATNVLQAMREASKTGGALGNVSEGELGLLENNIAALDPAQSMPAFQAQLDKIITYADDLKARMGQAYQDTYGEAYKPPERSPDTGSGNTRLRFNPETGELE